MVCEQGPWKGLGKEKWEMQLWGIKYLDIVKDATIVWNMCDRLLFAAQITA